MINVPVANKSVFGNDSLAQTAVVSESHEIVKALILRRILGEYRAVDVDDSKMIIGILFSI